MLKGRSVWFTCTHRSGENGGMSTAWFLLILAVFPLICAFPASAVECLPGAEPSRSATISLDALRTDPGKQEELTRYAKGIFLARLGFGTGAAAPPWTAGIQRACFVTFFFGKRVIACSGGFVPRTSDLGREIEANVRQALHLDPRALRIDRKTALAARVLITFPGEPRPVASYHDVDPAREGLFVENDRFGVAIVPGEAKTASWAFREALRRLGEKDPSQVRLFAFDAWGVRTGDGKRGEIAGAPPVDTHNYRK
jgi:hypothetical protein